MRMAIGRHILDGRRAWVAAVMLSAAICVAAPAAAQTAGDHQEPPDAPAPSPLVVRAFGSVQWGATELRDTPSSFNLGQFAIFLTAPLSDRVSVLAEVVMEGSVGTEVVTDLERLQLTFHLNDALRLTAGRYHTGIGFYNATFHHGAYFETPIGRPQVFAFEDEGGVLPVHEVGLSARGIVPRTGASLHYVAEVGNGRRWTPAPDEDAEATRDENGAKSVNLGLSYRPARWRGFEAGASFYRDAIPAPAQPATPHRIAASFLTYRTPALEVMGEWLRLTHRASDGRTYSNDAGYLQASRRFGKLRPYYRFDRLAIEPATPFIGGLGSYRAHIAGIRVDPSAWVGLKAQYERQDHRSQRGVDAVRTELVFVF